MNRLINRANRRVSMPGAASLLIATALIGQVLGFLRTMVINGSFPDKGPESTDAYFAAFKIPDFFFYTLAAGALGVAFIPILSERLAKSDRKSVWELSASLMNVMAIIMTIVGFVMLIFAEPLMRLVTHDKLTADQLHNATTIMRLISFNPLLFTLSGVLTSVQQTFGRFFFFAIGPLVYNLSIIAGAYLFRDNIGLIGLGIGAFIGAILQFLTACLGAYGLNFHYHPKINFKNTDFRRILRQLPPRAIDQGVDSINSIVETNRARVLGEGVVTAYENAFTLHTAPILLLGTTISTAAFPRMTERLAHNRPDLFRKDFLQVLKVLLWISLPVVVITYFGRGYLARLIFKRGGPDIALILGFLSVAILFRIIYTLFSRYFYAQKDTVTPLLVSIFAIGLNIFLAFRLARPEPVGYGPAGLAIAQSIVAASEVVILFSIMLWRDRHLFTKEFWSVASKIISITGFTIMAAFIMVTVLPLSSSDRGFFTLGFKFGSISIVTLLTHLSVSYMFGLEEAKLALHTVRKTIFKPIKIS